MTEKETQVNEQFSDKWQNEKFTITRQQFKEACNAELFRITVATKMAGFSKKQAEFLMEVVIDAFAGVGVALFPEDEENTEKEITDK